METGGLMEGGRKERWGGGCGVKGWREEQQKLTHLGSSSPMSIHGCWLSFVGVHLRS